MCGHDTRLFSFSPKMAREVAACDFSYFAAITAPHAPPERLRVVCDWGNWVRLVRGPSTELS